MTTRSYDLAVSLLSFPVLALLSAARGGSASSGMSGALGPSLTASPPSEEMEIGDQYQAVGTNPFTVAAHDPWSTFDVDTASCDSFRRDVNMGALPDPNSVDADATRDDDRGEFATLFAKARVLLGR